MWKAFNKGDIKRFGRIADYAAKKDWKLNFGSPDEIRKLLKGGYVERIGKWEI
jgi:hypothetical protein